MASFFEPIFDHIFIWVLVVTFIISQECVAHDHNHTHVHDCCNDHHVHDYCYNTNHDYDGDHKHNHNHYLTSSLTLDVSKQRQIPPHFFGIFFEVNIFNCLLINVSYILLIASLIFLYLDSRRLIMLELVVYGLNSL